MTLPPNLISDSSLAQETFDLLRRNGGRATYTEIVDCVFRISHAGAELAQALVSDLVRNDPRFAIQDTHLVLSGEEPETKPLHEIEFVVLDVEAIVSRSLPPRIIELGGYRVRAGEIFDQFETLVNPGVPLPPFIAALTGINEQMLAGAPTFMDVAAPWLAFASNAVLVAHNSMFDVPLLNQELARVYPGHRMRNAELCTVKLARQLMPQLDSHNLDALAEHFGFEITQRHRAAGDALATARVLLRLLTQLEALGVRTLAEARNVESRADAQVASGGDLQLALDV